MAASRPIQPGVPVAARGQGGLLDVALDLVEAAESDPDFPQLRAGLASGEAIGSRCSYLPSGRGEVDATLRPVIAT